MTILDVAQSGDDFYVRWQLVMDFDVMGKSRLSRTAGVTHLRFDENGKIVLHQDFWEDEILGPESEATPILSG